jgi:hypothetical protein
MWIVIGMVLALALGVYVGIGAPGFPGRQDRVVSPGRARRLQRKHIHWFKPQRRG